MHGFLSDGTRDVILLVGFALAVLQTLMPLASSWLVKPERTAAEAFRRGHQPIRAGTLRTWTEIVVSRDLKAYSAFVTLAVPAVFLGSYLLRPYFERDKADLFSFVVSSVTFVLALCSVAVFLVIIGGIGEIISKTRPPFDKLVSGMAGELILAAISLGALSLSLRFLKSLDYSPISWNTVGFLSYAFAWGVVSIFYLVAMTCDAAMGLLGKLRKS